MYSIKTKASFDSAHFLSGYKGKCSNIHGHRWTVEVIVSRKTLSTDEQTKGMVIDFGDLKKALKNVADQFDHAFIFEKNTLQSDTLACLKRDGFKLIELDFRPTAENLSKHFFDILKSKNFNPSSVAVYETPNNCAIFEED